MENQLWPLTQIVGEWSKFSAQIDNGHWIWWKALQSRKPNTSLLRDITRWTKIRCCDAVLFEHKTTGKSYLVEIVVQPLSNHTHILIQRGKRFEQSSTMPKITDWIVIARMYLLIDLHNQGCVAVKQRWLEKKKTCIEKHITFDKLQHDTSI